MQLMSEEEAWRLLKGLPDDIILHTKAVFNKAVEITEKIKANGYDVDLESVKIAAILHDLGRSKCISEGLDPALHGIESGNMLRDKGFAELARMCELHSAYVLSRSDLIEYSLEAKIITYADRLTKHDRHTTIRDRYNDLMQRYKQAQDMLNSIKLCQPKIEKIEKELLALMSDNK